MTRFTFPPSPTPGQVYVSGGAAWTYNGYAWIGGSGSTGSSPPPPPVDLPDSERYPFVTRPVPGKNLIPGDPLQGDYIVGRISVATLKDPATETMPLGLVRDLVNQNITVQSAASGTIFQNYDMRGGWTIDFHTNVYGFIIKNCLFDNTKKTSGLQYYACVDAYNNMPQSVTVSDNDFVGFRLGEEPFEDALVAWVAVADKSVKIQRNFMYYPPGDHVKIEAGQIEENFMYGGGTTAESHFDCVQVQQLNGPLEIRYNHMHGLGEGDVIGATNIIRAVPNDNTQGPKSHQIVVYQNVMRGCGHQIENDNDNYYNAQYYNNWQGDWMYSPHQIAAGTAGVRYFGNVVLTTGDPIADVNPP